MSMENFRGKIGAVLVIFIIVLMGVDSYGEEETGGGAPMEMKEKEALYLTIQGFVGNWWNGSDLYPDPCGWTPIQGVSCDIFDGLWYVTNLNIGPINDNSFACAQNVDFTPHLFALKHLKSLAFFSCFVSPHSHPVVIPTENWDAFIESLESLEFRSNSGLIGQIPINIGYLKKLESLVLLENGLTGVIPMNIGELTNLRRLVLAGNSLSGGIPQNFGGLSELLIMDLSRNSLMGPIPSTFGGLTSLLKLDLSYNKLNGKIPSQIGNLRSLTLLDLSSNKFSGGLTRSIEKMSYLKELVLANNPLGGDLGSVQWGKLESLVSLDLTNVGLTGGLPESMSELKTLRFMGLSENMLTGNLSPKLASLPNVSALYVNGNNLTGELKFSGGFYGKMGRRFGAWNNPNLCYYPNGSDPMGHGPFGVVPCQQGVMYNDGTKSKLGIGKFEENSQFTASNGFSRLCVDWLWVVILAGIHNMVEDSSVFSFFI